MAQVTLSIGGHSYSVACRDGEEDHLRGLGAEVDSKVVQAIGSVGSASESRGLLFGSLLLADALKEAQSGKTAAPAVPSPPSAPAPAIDLAPLEAIADKLEQLAVSLENRARSG